MSNSPRNDPYQSKAKPNGDHPAKPAGLADRRAGEKGGTASTIGTIWRRLREFSGLEGDATFLWPRWLVLRAVGIVYLFVFAGIIVESRAMIGPAGIAPLGTYLATVRQLNPGLLASFLTAPSLFWIDAGAGMIAVLGWAGLVAAGAVLLNLWPRISLPVCWLVFLSFVATWADFSSAQLDRLMLETALLCIPFAPRGLRPGLGANSPPRPIALFAMRWLLFRVMFESGIVKLLSADPHWRNLTAMDVMYETAPSPTILGYWDHQLPHAYHLLEIALTFAAELLAPIAATFGGRRGRWFAFATWTALQAGIQLTANFGWLNTAAIGLGLLLLDDQMIAAAAAKLGFGPRVALPGPDRAQVPVPVPRAWRRYGLRVALGVQIGVTLYYFAEVCGMPPTTAPAPISAVVKPFAAFCSANGYFLYESFDSAHHQVDFEGSNDGGRTWRSYGYRHIPQRPDRITPFLAPWYPRFEATIQIESWRTGDSTILPLVATELLRRNPVIMARFDGDPFPDRPPTVVRMRRYRMTFTRPASLRRAGNYWRKEFDGDYLPAMYVDGLGAVTPFHLETADAALKAGDVRGAREIYERQYRLGNLEAGYRLAQSYLLDADHPDQPEKAFELFADLAARGEDGARHNLGLCYENGIGTALDYVKAAEQYRLAAAHGSLLSLQALGALSADDHVVPRDDVEGLSLLLRAADRTNGPASVLARLREELPGQIARLMGRMTPDEIARARSQAENSR